MRRAALRFLEAEPGVELQVVAPPEEETFWGPLTLHPPKGLAAGDRDPASITAAALETAVALALEGAVGGIITGPVHKPTLQAGGLLFPGQTEFLQARAGVPAVGMLMAAERTRLGSPLRVLLATTHIPLASVPAAVTTPVLVSQALLLDGALREGWGYPEPRLALCAMNPHASDDGLFGDEEARVFQPAVEELESLGISISPPLPADTVFQRALAGDFHAVIAPYHDVGMAAFKTVSFGTGVNVTLGLPFVRTSPDHGTAFSLKGTGRADPSSALEALFLAARLARGRKASFPATQAF
ncbi:MAG: 4-hydroxythreonine-4-phosphate dehydrogenase PdxA [Gemmatimonadota bacterium]